MAEVTPRHRRIMILADYGEESLNLKNVRDWIETGVGGSPPWDRAAQALADIEAKALTEIDHLERAASLLWDHIRMQAYPTKSEAEWVKAEEERRSQ